MGIKLLNAVEKIESSLLEDAETASSVADVMVENSNYLDAAFLT